MSGHPGQTVRLGAAADAAGRGGWRYGWNYGSSDNSACQWGAIGMLAAQDIFGINIPAFVRRENQIWLAYSYNPGGYFGYDDNIPEWNWYSVTPSAMVQMAVNGTKTTNAIWRATEDYIAQRWPIENANSRLYYAHYAFVKAMRLAKPRNPWSCSTRAASTGSTTPTRAFRSCWSASRRPTVRGTAMRSREAATG